MKTWWKPSSSPQLPDLSRSAGSGAGDMVDAHVHIFPPELIKARASYLDRDARFAALYGSPRAAMATADALLQHMDEAGVAVSVAVGFAFRDQGLCRLANDYVIEAVQASPGRLAGLACVAPGQPGGGAELSRCLDAGLRGCGELVLDPGDPESVGGLRPLADCLEERGLPLMIHASEPLGHQYPGKGRFTPEACLGLASDYPGLTIVLSHMGGGLFLYELMPEVRAALARVYYDTAAVPYLYDPGVYAVAVACVGPEKLIFGSDYPLLPPERYSEGLDRLALKDGAAVRSGNARAVFGL